VEKEGEAGAVVERLLRPTPDEVERELFELSEEGEAPKELGVEGRAE